MSRVCDKCARLFTGQLLTGFNIYEDDSQRNKFRHHDNINSLERSVSDGCPSCRLVMSYINPTMLAVLQPDPSTASSYNIYAEMNKIGDYDPITKRQDYRAKFIFTFSAGTHNEMNYEEIEVIWNQAGKQSELPTWSDSTESGESWMCVQQWLGICLEHHKNCSRNSAMPLWNPTRLLDLGPQRAELPLRLIEREEIPPGSDYTTLSHCCKCLRSIFNQDCHI